MGTVEPVTQLSPTSGDAAPPAPIDHTGRVVLVTGGAKGIGRGITHCYLDAGATVIVCGRNEVDELPTTGRSIASFEVCDVRDADAVDQLINDIVARHGSLDVVINNAGGSPEAEAATVSPRFSEAIIRLNLIAPLIVATSANRVMQSQLNGGVIINIASVSAVRPSPGTAAYGAAKAGLISLTASLAVEWAPAVRLVAVICGLIETEQSALHYGDSEGLAAVAATIPLGRMGTPDDVGRACTFLSSPHASYISGSSITLHGGGERPAFLNAAAAHR